MSATEVATIPSTETPNGNGVTEKAPGKEASSDKSAPAPKLNGVNGEVSQNGDSAPGTLKETVNGNGSQKNGDVSTASKGFNTTNSIVHNRPPPTTTPADAAPAPQSLEENIRHYRWTYGPDKVRDEVKDPEGNVLLPAVYLPYPPHALWNVPADQPPSHERKEMYEIFDPAILMSVKGVLSGADQLYFRLPTEEDLEGEWTLRSLAEANRRCYEEYQKLKATGEVDPNLNPLFKNNIADRDDWYTDATFAQQHFTGPNPTTITIASGAWISRFKEAAKSQHHDTIADLLTTDSASFYVQDNSYFRAAMRLDADVELKSTPSLPGESVRYACASVSLFRLEENGMLHPVAIIIDYRGDMQSSVTIFNRRNRSSDGKRYEEYDWPWRYAKMCALSSDWLRHEVTIHLTNTHLVEEAVIVSAHRTLSPGHPVFQLMKEHWATTLSVNLGARNTLIPGVILPLAGIDGIPLVQFLNHAYESFDWKSLYIPNDLNSRGFPMLALEHDPKFKDYAYGRNMALMWPVLRKFVASHISRAYEGRDSRVVADAELSAFCAEMRGAARITSFPDVRTVEELIDMVTMCIHIAAPQHTAVNYLQHYYQVFVPNKPPALYQPLPKTLNELLGINEKFITGSLPGLKNIKDWQLAALLPFLLSQEVIGDQSFMQYAKNVEASSDHDISESGRLLRLDLEHLRDKFIDHSLDLEERHPDTWYTVMDPYLTANSILI